MRMSGDFFKKCIDLFDLTNFLFIPIKLSLSYQIELDPLHFGYLNYFIYDEVL